MTVYSERIDASKGVRAAGIEWTPAGPDGVEVGGLPAAGTVRIMMGKVSCGYTVTEFPVSWHGRGFHLEKLGTGTDADESGYDVFCGANGQDKMCSCKGFTRHNRCKHLAAAEALLANGWL